MPRRYALKTTALAMVAVLTLATVAAAKGEMAARQPPTADDAAWPPQPIIPKASA